MFHWTADRTDHMNDRMRNSQANNMAGASRNGFSRLVLIRHR